MCGRYATTTNPGRLAAELDAIDETATDKAVTDKTTEANYNVAPTTQVLTVVERHQHGHPDDDPRLRLRHMRWGLIPLWTKVAEPGVPVKGKPLFNARADKAATTASFRDAVKYRRCLVPMDGWYEWVTEPQFADVGPESGGGTNTSAKAGKSKAVKQPYFMASADGSRLYMAGLWSVWRDRAEPDSEPLLSCAILTTDAVGDLTQIHHRMPLPMPRQNWAAWLDPDHRAPAELLETPSEESVAGIVARPVPALVNSVRNNGPRLLARLDAADLGGAVSGRADQATERAGQITLR